MKLLITGATGHSGQFFLEHLNEDPIYDEVICVIRHEEKIAQFSRFKNIKFQFVVGDLDNFEKLISRIGSIDVVLNIANIRYSLDILEVRKNIGFTWFIGVHTTGKYSKFKTASQEYIEIEESIKDIDDVDITLLRPTMIYGSMKDRNMSRLIDFINKSPVFPIFGKGKNLMQPVAAQDLGEAYYKVMKNAEVTKNKNYNLSGKEAMSYESIIKTVAKHLEKNVRIINIPIKISTILVNLGNKITSKFPINEEQVLRMQEDKVFSHEDALIDFGYSPRSFDEGIKFEITEYIHQIGR